MATDPAPYAGPRYRLWDLLNESGVSPATYNNWRRQGLLPPAVRQGRHSFYTGAHLTRLRRIVAVRDQNRTLADIRDYLDPEPDDEEITPA